MNIVVVLEILVVIGAIVLGVQMGGLGLGLWGVAGVGVLVFVFGLAPGEPPTSAMLIILAVITAAAAMQAAGGIDYPGTGRDQDHPERTRAASTSSRHS